MSAKPAKRYLNGNMSLESQAGNLHTEEKRTEKKLPDDTDP